MRTGFEFAQEFEKIGVVEGKGRVGLLASQQACFGGAEIGGQVVPDTKLADTRALPGLTGSENLPYLFAAGTHIESIPKHHAIGEPGNNRRHAFRLALILLADKKRQDLSYRISFGERELQKHHTHHVRLLLGASFQNLN